MEESRLTQLTLEKGTKTVSSPTYSMRGQLDKAMYVLISSDHTVSNKASVTESL